MELNVQLPVKCAWVLSKKCRYKLLYGGRGSAKSWSVARYLVSLAAFRPVRVLCAREMQNSIKESVHRLLADQIAYLELSENYDVLKDSIRSKCGSEFVFKGLRHNISEVKSLEGIDICWVEEAEKVSDDSWKTLIPTIRNEESEIIVTWNPEEDGSATDKRFVKNFPPSAARAFLNYPDNPWFPEVLRKEMEYNKRVDFELYEHIWLGKYKKYSDALIFKGKVRVEEFDTPERVRFYFGADFGFSNDPTVLARMFVHERKLYIDHEVYGVGIEITDLHRFFSAVPESRKWKIVADSQRPDTISHLSRSYTDKDGTVYPGFNIVGAEKGKGSVEDGIEFLRSFEAIVIHPRCRGCSGNFLNYRWKRDRVTEDILPIPADGSDHGPDAARYALEGYIKKKTSIFDVDYGKVNLEV